MSVDTRTPRFDEQPALSMTKVDSDPAQVIVNHASFRVQLAPGQRARLRGARETARIPAMSGAGGGRRRAPVVWSGKSAPGDPGATGLLQAVRNSTAGHLDAGLGARPRRRARPRSGRDAGHPAPGGDAAQPRTDRPHQPGRTGPLLPPMRQAVGAYDDPLDGPAGPGDDHDDADSRNPPNPPTPAPGAERATPSGTPDYPGHRMNLGVVLLPMRSSSASSPSTPAWASCATPSTSTAASAARWSSG